MRSGVLVILSTLAAASAWARVDAENRVTLFQEPGKDNDGVTVIHPQTDVTAGLGESASISAGYEVDMVSGATPSLYSRSAVDAITAPTRFDDLRQAARASLGWNATAVGINAWILGEIAFLWSTVAAMPEADRNFFYVFWAVYVALSVLIGVLTWRVTRQRSGD